MSGLGVIFIDTSIFDEQRYHFQSAAISAFLQSAKARPTLLLPAPTEREVLRHINEQVDAATKVVGDARRRAPILTAWPGWPATFESRGVQWQLRQFAHDQWNAFLQQFNVQRLGYDTVSLSRVMNWYEFKRAPFALGKKSKEFPDAIAVDAIATYAEKNNTPVCVVSKDSDFKNACAYYSGLMHFSSLAALTEAILSADERVPALRTLLGSNRASLERKISEAFPDCSFYPADDPMGDVEDVVVDEVEITDFNVIALGETEYSVAFDARIAYSASVSFDDPDSLVGDSEDGYFAMRRLSGTVCDASEMSGIAKVLLHSSAPSGVEVVRLEFDTDDVAVSGSPDEGWSDDSSDDYPDEE